MGDLGMMAGGMAWEWCGIASCSSIVFVISTVLCAHVFSCTQGLARDRTLAGLPRDAEWVWKAGPIFDWRLLAAHPLPHLHYLNLSYAASMEHYAGNDHEGFAQALQWLAQVQELHLPRTCTWTPLPTTTSDVGWSLRMAMNDVFGCTSI